MDQVLIEVPMEKRNVVPQHLGKNREEQVFIYSGGTIIMILLFTFLSFTSAVVILNPDEAQVNTSLKLQWFYQIFSFFTLVISSAQHFFMCTCLHKCANIDEEVQSRVLNVAILWRAMTCAFIVLDLAIFPTVLWNLLTFLSTGKLNWAMYILWTVVTWMWFLLGHVLTVALTSIYIKLCSTSQPIFTS